MGHVPTLRSLRRTLGRFVLLCALVPACAKSEEDWVADLTSPDPYVRALASIGWAVQAPRTAGPALPVLLETIDRSELGLERDAAAALQLAGGFHVEALLESLTSDAFPTEDRRGAILNALVNAGAAAARPIVACLQGPGREQAGDLGEVLLRIGEPAVPAIAELAQSSQDTSLQQFALFLLARLGPDARSSLPVLRAALDSPDEGVRRMAGQALELVEGAGTQRPPAAESR